MVAADRKSLIRRIRALRRGGTAPSTQGAGRAIDDAATERENRGRAAKRRGLLSRSRPTTTR